MGSNDALCLDRRTMGPRYSLGLCWTKIEVLILALDDLFPILASADSKRRIQRGVQYVDLVNHITNANSKN